MIQVQTEGKPVDMELDTGSSISVTFISLWNPLQKNKKENANARLRTYENERITPVGTVTATVRYGNQSCEAKYSAFWPLMASNF